MTVNEYLKSTFKINNAIYNDSYPFRDRSEWIPNVRPRIVCEDGFSFSAQANCCTYCSPRTTLWPENWGDGYSEVELGFPSSEDELINDYAEDNDYTNTVYGYVPVEIVDKLIEKHGGIKQH